MNGPRHVANAESYLAFLHRQQPDVIMMDINLPDRSGIDLCKEVKTKHPAIQILGLSTFNQCSFIEKMMEQGASGYLLKNAGRKELLKAIDLACRANHTIAMRLFGHCAVTKP